MGNYSNLWDRYKHLWGTVAGLSRSLIYIADELHELNKNYKKSLEKKMNNIEGSITFKGTDEEQKEAVIYYISGLLDQFDISIEELRDF